MCFYISESCFDPKFKADHKHNVILTQCRPMDTVIQLDPADPEIMVSICLWRMNDQKTEKFDNHD